MSDASAMDGGPSDFGLDRPDRFLPDMGLRDLGPPDLYRYDGPTDCSEVGGFRRCDEPCPGLCPDRIRCPEIIPLCVPPRVVLPDGNCNYVIADPATGLPSLPGGWLSPDIGCDAHAFPCALRDSYPAESGTSGYCLPLAVCLDDRPVGFPEFHCTWSDMTLVTGPPPPVACPPDVNATSPFCGGACTRIDCPDGACVGLSNTRGFGVCRVLGGIPLTGFASSPMRHWRGSFLDDCRTDSSASCAFFVPLPQPSEPPFGWPVVADACLAYRAIYPANVECRDADWNLLP